MMKKIFDLKLLTSLFLLGLSPISYADDVNILLSFNNGYSLQKVGSKQKQEPVYNSQYNQSDIVINKTGKKKKSNINIPEHDDVAYTSNNITPSQVKYYKNIDYLVNEYVLGNDYKQDTYASHDSFIKPVNYKINSEFGMRFHPIDKVRKMHTGVDFAAPMGTPIKAANSGYVEFSGVKGGYGKAVIIKHDDRYSSLYGHASKLLVTDGQYVERGQVIALVGSTGKSTGPHLHFEIFEYGKRINPRIKLNSL